MYEDGGDGGVSWKWKCNNFIPQDDICTHQAGWQMRGLFSWDLCLTCSEKKLRRSLDNWWMPHMLSHRLFSLRHVGEEITYTAFISCKFVVLDPISYQKKKNPDLSPLMCNILTRPWYCNLVIRIDKVLLSPLSITYPLTIHTLKQETSLL